MFLYTIVPPEQILYQAENSVSEYRKLGQNYVQGAQADGHFVVQRLISTDPSLYLNPRYAPGGRL